MPRGKLVAPPLKDWVTAEQLASEASCSRQAINRLMNRGHFKSLRALGNRPIYVISRKEADKFAASLTARRQEQSG